MKKLRSKKGFTLVELVCAVAILAVLLTLAITNVLGSQKELSLAEYNNNAEAIAVAAQSRLNSLRSSGDVEYKTLGTEVTIDGETVQFIASNNEKIGKILPYFSLDGELWNHSFVIGFQPATGKVFSVYFYPDKFTAETTFDSLKTSILGYESDSTKCSADGIGYYKRAKDDDADITITGAHLPTPQITINNFEELTVDVYLPLVQQLPEHLELGFKVFLLDENKTIFNPMKNTDPTEEDSYTIITVNEGVSLGTTYSFVLDTPREILNGTLPTIEKYKSTFSGNDLIDSSSIPVGRFSTWAHLTAAYYGDDEEISGDLPAEKEKNLYGFKLGDDVTIVVKVFAVKRTGSATVESDPIYIERFAETTFNGWFDSLTEKDGKTFANVSCGRHLQNIGRMTKIRGNLQYLLPTSTWNGSEYTDYKYGIGNAYSYVQSSEVKYAKYVVLDNVNNDILGAIQLMPINFANAEWKDILFDPLGTVEGFIYYGNYYPIYNLKVHTDLYAGMFSYTYRNKIYDVRLVNPSVRSDMPLEVSRYYEMGVGALIGTDRASSEIYNCQVYLDQKAIQAKETEKPRVCGNGYVGGLIGFCEDEDLRQCSASVYVGNSNPEEYSPYVGGLVGGVTGDSDIKRCYTAGILRGQYVGGIVGAYIPDTDYSGDELEIESCYTAGNIESATVNAAGLIGYTRSEQRGYEKAAIRAASNYCVVIYGEDVSEDKTGTAYQWKATLKNYTKDTTTGEYTVTDVLDTEGKPISTPIYGTFEGDNFVWMYADGELIAEKSAYTDNYRVLAGAYYSEENYNYYVAQKDINYSHSSLWQNSIDGNSLVDLIKNFAETNTLTKDSISTLQTQIKDHKYFQVLEEVRAELISLYNEVYDFKNPANGENILIDFDFTKNPNDASDDNKTWVDSHGSLTDKDRNTLLTTAVTTMIGDPSNPAENTALWYLDKLETLLKDKTASVEVSNTANNAKITYTYNGTDGKNGFDELLRRFAVNFFAGAYDSSKKGKDGGYYWPYSATETRRGALENAFYDVRQYFEEESYFELSTFYDSDAELRSQFSIEQGEDGFWNVYENKELIVEKFCFDKDYNLVDENGKKVDGETLQKIYYKFNSDGSVKESRKLQDGYKIEDGRLWKQQEDGSWKVLNADFPFNVDKYLLDDDDNIQIKTQGSDEFYIIEGFKDRLDENILEMLYSLHHNQDSDWQLKYFLGDTSKDIFGEINRLWKDSDGNEGYARSVVNQAEDYLKYIEKVDIESGSLGYNVTGDLIKSLINEIFGGDFGQSRKNRTEALKNGLFGQIMEYMSTDYNKVTLRKMYDYLYDRLNLLYKYFDKAKDYFEENDKDGKNSSGYKHMKDLRSTVSSLMSSVDTYSKLSFVGGVDEFLDYLSDILELSNGKVTGNVQLKFYDGYMYNKYPENTSVSGSATVTLNVKDEIDKYMDFIKHSYLYDSGHPLYNEIGNGPLQQLRDFTMDTTDWGDTGTFDHDDWYGYADWGKYQYGKGDDFNKTYFTRVFPYHEKGNYTAVYPFPMVIAIEVEGTDNKVTPMLHHYGDWLTPDLWAPSPESAATVSTLSALDTGITGASDYISNEITTSQVTGNHDKEPVKAALNTCAQLCQKAMTDLSIESFQDLCDKIDEILEPSGVFTVYMNDFDTNKGGHSEEMKKIYADLSSYKTVLQEQIAKLKSLNPKI